LLLNLVERPSLRKAKRTTWYPAVPRLVSNPDSLLLSVNT
jgi:hypothetical protein